MAGVPKEIREVKDKVIVVTGGTSGIGLNIVKHLLSHEPKHIAIFDLDNENSRSVFKELQDRYRNRIGFHVCDVTKNEIIAKNFDKVIESQGTIDILLNNAGIAEEDKPELLIDINFKAVVMASYMFLDRVGIHKGGKGGLIVNTASILGIISLRLLPVYSATKHGVVTFTRTLQESYGNTGVRVLAICPGFTLTPLLKKFIGRDFFESSTDDLEKYYQQSSDNVANAVVEIIKKDAEEVVWAVTKDKPAFPVAQKENFSDYL